MALPKETQDRIEQEAKRRGENHMFIPMDGDYSSYKFHGFIVERSYIAGATAEATNAESIRLQLEAQDANVEILLQQKKEFNERVQKLVGALGEIAAGNCDYEDTGYVKQVHSSECKACRAKEALQQWNAGKEVAYKGSVITEPAPGISLGCISPEARELLDTIMEQWEKHYASMKEMHGDAMPETTFYGFAYWLVRWSGLVQPAGKEAENEQPEPPLPDVGICAECKSRPATTDYNEYGYFVCKLCYDSLNREFDEEYR